MRIANLAGMPGAERARGAGREQGGQEEDEACGAEAGAQGRELWIWL